MMPQLARRLFHDGASAARSTEIAVAAAQQARSYGTNASSRRRTPFASNSALSPSPSPKSPGGKVEKKPAAPKWNQGYLSFLESKSVSQSLRASM